MDYPRSVSCSRCTTRLEIEDAVLEAFVACPSCGASPCEKCEQWFDAGELVVHAASCTGSRVVIATQCDGHLVVDDDCWSFWEQNAPTDEEIEVEWEWETGEVRWAPATVVSLETTSGVRVEYLEDDTGDGKEYVHGLRLCELSVDERLDVLAVCDENTAVSVPWLRCEASAEILTDLVGDRPRRWRPRRDEQDNGRVAYRDAQAAIAIADQRWFRNACSATGESPCKKQRHTRRAASEARMAVSLVALAEAKEAHFAAMAAFLDNVELPRSERKNVLRKSCELRPRAANVGVTVLRRPHRVTLSQGLDLHDHLLAQALAAFFRSTSPFDRPFTSIQINRCDSSSQTAALHQDRNNLGPSLILGLGPYSGGQLWTSDRGLLNVKHEWTEFDGRLPHAALPFDGQTRYTLIFWCCNDAHLLPRSQRRHAERLGFCFPTATDNPPPLPNGLSLSSARQHFRTACALLPRVPPHWADD